MKCEDLHFGNRLNHIPYVLVQIHVILIQTVSSKLAIRSVPNSVVELSRGYSIIMKRFRLMHAQNKFYYKRVRDRRIVASVAEFSV